MTVALKPGGFVETLAKVERTMLDNLSEAGARRAVMGAIGTADPTFARRWMAAVRRLWRLNAGKDTAAHRAELITRYRDLYDRAITANDLDMAEKALWKLAQLHAAVAPDVTGKSIRLAVQTHADGTTTAAAELTSGPVTPVFIVQPSQPRSEEVLRLTGGKTP